jgi:hypothetical protein
MSGRNGLLTSDVMLLFKSVTSDWQSVMMGMNWLKTVQVEAAIAMAKVSIAKAEGGAISVPLLMLIV